MAKVFKEVATHATRTTVIEMEAPLAWDFVLNPEALLDCNQVLQNANCVKFRVNSPPISDADFVELVNGLDIGEAIQKKEVAMYSTVGSRLKKEALLFQPGNLLNVTEPFTADIDLLDPTKFALHRKYGMEKWRQMKGILPSVFPDWKGISSPMGSVFGKGVCVGFGQENKKFGFLNYLRKGFQRWVVLNHDDAKDLNETLAFFLRAHGCPPNLLRCPHYLNHGELMINEDFLIRNLKAKAFDQAEGEAVLINSGVFFQSMSTSAGLSISNNFVPRKWLSLNAMDCCKEEDNGDDITDDNVLTIKRAAIHAKEYAGAVSKLARKGIGNIAQVPMLNIETPIPIIRETIETIDLTDE